MATRHRRLDLAAAKTDRGRRSSGVRLEKDTRERALTPLRTEALILRAHRRLRGAARIARVFDEQ